MTNEEILRAVADGKQLQIAHPDVDWEDVSYDYIFAGMGYALGNKSPLGAYRIKPEPKPDVVIEKNVVASVLVEQGLLTVRMPFNA